MREASHAAGGVLTEGSEGLVDSAGRKENLFGTFGEATDYFVADEYRPGQREAIEAIQDAFEQGFRYVLLDAPTGSGKSHIARAFAFQSNDAHILTVQKLLQDQYQNDFPGMYIMKGRSAYVCVGGADSCASGPCRLSNKYPRHSECPYAVAKAEAAQAPVTVHNFDSFFYQNSFGRGYKGRSLLIVDEAHNIENKYGEFMSFTLSSKMGFEIPEYQRLKHYDEFVRRVHDELSDELDILKEVQDAAGLSEKQSKRMTDLNSLVSRMGRYLMNRERDDPIEYIFDYTDNDKVKRVQFRPVMIGDFARKMLFTYGERVLMMSATILDKRLFCESVGLDQDEVAYIQVPSYFPPENRPIVKKFVGSMNYKSIDATLPKLVEEIEQLMAKHSGRKGIIQTHSEKVAEYIREHIDDPRLTFNKDYPTPASMLFAHRMKDASFIVASGLREGLDLRGDLSQVQILCKIPYPSLADKRVKRRMELDPDWYGYVTSLMFVQILGRSVRSGTERAVTYLLDSGFGYFYHRNKQFIPSYVKKSIAW